MILRYGNVKKFSWTSSNYLPLFVLVVCFSIIECTLGADDANDISFTESSAIQQSRFKEILVYTYAGMDHPQYDIGKIYLDDIGGGHEALKRFNWRNGFPSHPTFSLNKTSGMISMEKETKPGAYRLDFNVTDGEHLVAAATVLVTVKNLSVEATRNHGFIRFADISGEKFIQTLDSKTTMNAQTYADKLQTKISQIFNTTKEHVDIFSVMTNQTNGTPYTDVRFSVCKTPGYYNSAILNGLVLLHRKEIEQQLEINITIVDIDGCLNDMYCQGRCTTIVKPTGVPITVDANKLSLVGPQFVTSFQCGYSSDFSSRNCKMYECFNGGLCMEGKNGPTCKCIAAHWTQGPRCQVKSRTFTSDDVAWYPPLDADGELSFEFITKKEHGLLLYSGPITNPKPGDEGTGIFFISLELVHGQPRLLLDSENGTIELRVPTNGTLADGVWHRIDLKWHRYWDWSAAELTVDLCKDAVRDENDNGKMVNSSNCQNSVRETASLTRMYFNTPLQVGGIYAANTLNASSFNWTRVPTRESFDGCIRNLIMNNQMYNLGNPHYSRYKVTPGCRQLEDKCKKNKTLSRCLKHGACVGTFASEPRCECEPGWMGHDCTQQTVPTSFKNGSYVKYALSGQLDPFEMHIQFRFRTWERDAEIFYMSNHDNTQFGQFQIRYGKLQFACNFSASFWYDLYLSNYVNVSDGQWHNVKVSRFGATAMMEVDSGEGWIHKQIRRNFEGPQFMTVDGHEGVYAGGLRHSIGNGSINVSSGYQNGCLDDIRLNGIHLPLSQTSSDTREVQATMIGELEEGCRSNDPCRNASCPKPFKCFDIWRKHECGCTEGNEKITDGNKTKCVDTNECLENPCFNGGTCINLEPPQRFHCECLSEYWGATCGESYQKGPSPPHIVKQPPTEESLFKVKQCGDESDKPFTIECEAKGNLAAVYRWTKNGINFDWKADGDRITQKKEHGTLVFNSPKSDDAGQYQCFASNKWGTASTNSVFMRRAVLKSFKNQESATTVTAEIGRPFKLTCSPPKGWPKPQISWVLQNSEGALKSINFSRITVDPDGTLWFSNITRGDIISGYMYACAAYSEATYETKLGNKRLLNIFQSSDESSMKIHEPVPQYVTRQKTMAIKGSPVRLWCIIGGTPLPEIKWTKNGEPVEEEKRIKYENYNKTLKIDNVDLEDKDFMNVAGVSTTQMALNTITRI